MPFVPVEEAKYSPAVKAYVKAVGGGVIDGNVRVIVPAQLASDKYSLGGPN